MGQLYRHDKSGVEPPPRRQLAAVVTVKYGAISFLSANPRSTFDSAPHFYGGDTTSLTLPAAVPADSLVCLGSNLLPARFNWRGFFSECFIPSTTDTSEHDKTPVDLCARHNRPLFPNPQLPVSGVGSATIRLPYTSTGSFAILMLPLL